MIASLRRTRWIATVLLALAPGTGGQLVAAFHPCPMEREMAGGGSHVAMAGGPHAGAPGQGHHDHGGSPCNCVGHCSAPAVAALPRTPLIPTAMVVPSFVAPLPVQQAGDHQTPLPERLPPSIPPPLG